MHTVQQIYDEYRIPPWLQLHQLRVASVGKMLAERIPEANERDVILTGLFHDMGNILKFDLSDESHHRSLVPDGELEYWRSVRSDFAARFGENEHEASLKIAREIGLPDTVVTMIEGMRFSKTVWVRDEASVEMKIAKYGDLRVAPLGIVSLQERLAEGAARYRGKAFDTGDAYDPDLAARINAACFDLEAQLTEHLGFGLDEITEDRAAPIMEVLRLQSV